MELESMSSRGIEITPRDKVKPGKPVRVRKDSFARLKQLKEETGRSMAEILDLALEQVRVAGRNVVMAGTPSGIDPRMLESMLRMKLELPAHRTAAAMLTVAFQ